MTGPGSLRKSTASLSVLLLLLAASLYTGSSGFRVRENSDICTNEKCSASASSSTPWASSGVRPKRGFGTVSTRGSFAKLPNKEADEAQDEENSVVEKRTISKWKEKKTRTWSKLTKSESDELNEYNVEDKVDSDDESIQVEIEDDADDEEEVVIEDEEESDESQEKASLEEETNESEKESGRRLNEEKTNKVKGEEEKRKKEEEKLRRKEELEKQMKLDEEKRKKEKELEEKRKQEEAERKRKEATERKLKEEAEQRLREAERKRKDEEERKRKEEERRRKEEERVRKEALEQERRKEEEQRKREEEERKLKEMEEQKRKEKELKELEERRRQEEEEKRLDEERRIKEDEERRLREEEECRLAEEEEERLKAIEERVLREEQERKEREEEEERKMKELEAEKERKAIEEAEKLKSDEEDEEIEKKRDALEDKKRVQRLKKEAEEKKMREGKERKKPINAKKNTGDLGNESEDDEDEDSEDEEDDSLDVKKTVENLRFVDTDTLKTTEAPRIKLSSVIDRKTPVTIEPTPKSKTSDEINEKSSKQPLAKKSTTTESTPKRGDSEAPLNLVELNNVLLSMPTFVPNFTAIEDPHCRGHGKIFLRQLRAYKLWALQMLDSSAKIPAGLLRGNVNQLGDFDQCLNALGRIKLEDNVVKIQGKYCLANIDLYASHPSTSAAVNLIQSRALIRGNIRDPGHFIPKFTTVNWAVCLPAACSSKNAQKSIERALNSYNTTIGITFVVDVDSDNCYVKQKPSSYSKETIGVLYFYAMFVCLAIIATLRDYIGSAKEKGNYSERIIMAFSLKRTLKALFGNKETSPSDIGCIHGVRALSTAALYVAHKLIPTSRIPYANRVLLTEVASHPLSLILRASLFYTDSFLLLSGVLTAYNMAKELQDRGEIRWFCRLLARYMRLTPSLLAVVFWYAFVMEHTGSGPQWNAAVKANADICKRNSWINFLYVQNFFPFEDMCATHTHQLALDMQLSLLAPALVFFLQIKPIIGIIIVFFLLQVSATLRYFATYNNNLSLVIFHGMTIQHLYKTANLTYTLPLHRATPYVFGVSLGVLLQYLGKSLRLNKIVAFIGWSIALALGSWSIFSPWHLAKRDYVYNVDEATHYAVVSPILTALALSWTIFACFTDNTGIVNRILSSYWMVVFSKLSYAIYLSQFAVFFYNVGTTRYASEFHPFRALNPLEAACVVFVSVILTLLFDIPMQEVKNIIMESSDSVTMTETDKPEDDAEENHKDVNGIPRESSFEDEDEPYPGVWNWNRGTFTKLARSEPREYEDSAGEEPPFRSSRLKRQDVRRQTIIRSDTFSSGYDEWDTRDNSRRTSRSEEPIDYRRSSRGYRFSGSGLEDELEADDYDMYPRERIYSRAYTKSPGRDSESTLVRRSHASAEPDIPPREYSNKPVITISKDDDYQESRSSRSGVPRFTEQQRSMSSDSEFDHNSRRSGFTRHSSAEPRVIDEDEWEEDSRLQRGRFFQDRLSSRGSQEHDHVPPPIEEEEADDEWADSLKRRSSAEGKMALLKEPTGPGNIALWTVSKIHLGSSQEPDDEEFDEEGYHRKRTEYREQGPPLREELENLEESSTESRRRSFTSGSLPTSFEDEDDVSEFSLKSDSKRITVQDLSRTVQDLSRLSSEEESLVGSNPNQLDVKLGLIKRESIIKSQASEEDPEYLIPERPKLVEQEQEHPFKKAWQMQKSRSEEEGSSAFVVRDVRSASTSLEKQDEEPDDKTNDGGETSREGAQSEGIEAADVSCDVTLVWQARSHDADKNGDFVESRSSSVSLESDEEEYDDEDQIEGYRRKSDEETWSWTDKDT
ncbi:uncharacterized protein LOC106642345 [Copidosoma floridanum]|uniref:uncharacterized protein LOC106642345 n=1 Tax=Copidosoma floridanum TaxID=29053 RepID=UPI0006C9D166|nr:uncharacterized protein LOC106642345 [Copidosoma floridanum]